MPVTRVGAAQNAGLVNGFTGSGSMPASVNVPATAGENVYAVIAAGYGTDVDITAASFSAAWPGETLVPLFDPIFFGSDKQVMLGWIVENPAAGIGAVTFSHSGVPGAFWACNRFLAVGVWSQATPLDMDNIEDVVVTAVGSTPTTVNEVTVPSASPAHRVISAHFVTGSGFSNFTGTRVAAPQLGGGNFIVGNGGQLILGESRGAASVDATATQGSIGSWAAFGLNLEPEALSIGAASRVNAGIGRVGGSVYRFAQPHPDRFYVVPKVGTVGASGVLAGNFVPSADGVPMPVWTKDPDDTNDYTLDWSNHLAEDDRITHVEHTLSGSLRKFSEAIDDTGVMTQVWINGSTVDVTRSVRVRCSTARGRRFDRTFWIAGTSN